MEGDVSSSINIPAYSDALVVLGTAGIVVPLLHRWGLSPVLGYLGAGALLGPLGLGSFITEVPLLYWFTVVDAKNVAGIADLKPLLAAAQRQCIQPESCQCDGHRGR